MLDSSLYNKYIMAIVSSYSETDLEGDEDGCRPLGVKC